jgi:putative addiction module component (TIGR02574 family)
MTKSDLIRMALRPPREEQLEIAQAIWERAAPSVDFTVPPELRDLLEARLLEAHSNPETGISWEEIKACLAKGLSLRAWIFSIRDSVLPAGCRRSQRKEEACNLSPRAGLPRQRWG